MGCFSCGGGKKPEHFRPRRKDKVWASEQECDLCGVISWEVSYCSFCRKWLCPKCAKDPVKRFRAAVKEKLQKKKSR